MGGQVFGGRSTANMTGPGGAGHLFRKGSKAVEGDPQARKEILKKKKDNTTEEEENKECLSSGRK